MALVRGQHNKHPGAELGQYVNDRPYAASSLLAVALKEAFRTALTGRCDARPELAAARYPAHHPRAVLALPRRRRPRAPDLRARSAGASTRAASRCSPPSGATRRTLDLRLTGELRLADALNHLYVLLPVLDDAKHYWVSTDEVDKLVRAGGDWLAGHPEKELITRRYLSHQRKLTQSALARLADADDTDPDELDNAVTEEDRPTPLAVQRREAILAVLRERGARRIGDFGCGSGVLTKDLLADKNVERVVATDVSARALQLAARHLRLDQMPDQQRDQHRDRPATSSVTGSATG